MKKLANLREHLLNFPGQPGIEPGHLITYAENGQTLAAAAGTNEHWELQYEATVIITNFSGRSNQLFFWVLQWLHQAQPDHDTDAIRWQADILNERSADLSLTVPLTETVKVSRTDDGIILHHADEPDLVEEILEAQEWSLYIGDDEDPAADWVAGNG